MIFLEHLVVTIVSMYVFLFLFNTEMLHVLSFILQSGAYPPRDVPPYSTEQVKVLFCINHMCYFVEPNINLSTVLIYPK